MADAQILRAARARIADPIHWTTGHFACDEQGIPVHPTDPKAICWCSIGTLRKEGSSTNSAELGALKVAASDLFGLSGPAKVNDTLGHEAVLAMYDAAIASAEASV